MPGTRRHKRARSWRGSGRRSTGAGYTPADVVDGLVYLTDLSLFPQMNDEYREFFEEDFPARATVGTGLVATRRCRRNHDDGGQVT